MRKTFLLGVGCQKGGTTWLHDYLVRHPNADMGFRKEYHLFDALFVPECRVFLDEIKARAAALIAQAPFPLPGDHQIIKLLGFYADPREYFDYFLALATRSDETRLVGDISPSYCSLPAEAFAEIKRELSERGIEVKVVFVMRDPVDRCISASRMGRRNAAERGESLGPTDKAIMVQQACARDYEIRTRYESTIRNLEKVFTQSEIFYGFYESFFCAESIRRLTSFLDIPFVEPDFTRRLNVSSGDPLDASGRLAIYQHYRETYDYVASRFGHAELSRIWANHREFSA